MTSHAAVSVGGAIELSPGCRFSNGRRASARACGQASALLRRLQAERAAEYLAHDLVAAAADRAQARVARRPLDPVLAHVARAAVDLQAGVHPLQRGA